MNMNSNEENEINQMIENGGELNERDSEEVVHENYPCAQDIWDSYIDGERDMREDFTFIDRLSESLESYKKYYDYRFGNTRISTTSKKEADNQKETIDTVTSLLYEMSKDPRLSSFLILQVLPFHPNINSINKKDQETIIHHFARYGNVDALTCIFSLFSDVKSGIPNKRGQTPLILACTSYGESFQATSANKVKTVKLLLERRDCNINHLDVFDRNALFYSFQDKNLKAFRYLLKKHASVISTLSLYTILVPELLALDRALKHGQTPQQQMQNIRNSVNLRKFLSTEEVSNDMVDFNESYAGLMLKVTRIGTISIMKGMLFYKIREELRYLKLADPPLIQNKFTVKEEAPPLVDTYERDLMIRDKFKAQRKKEKSDAVRERKEKQERKEWDEKRAKTSARLETEFNVKVKGLFV